MIDDDTARTTPDDLTLARLWRRIDYLCERFDVVELKLLRRIEALEDGRDDLLVRVRSLQEWRNEHLVRGDVAALNAWFGEERDDDD